MRIGARRRLELCLDRGAMELFADLEPVDFLKFKDKRKYRDRLTAAQRSTGEKDALIAMRGSVLGVEVVTLAFEFDFHGGSMGYAVGAAFTRAATVALNEGLPLICFQPRRCPYAGSVDFADANGQNIGGDERLGQGTPYISVLTDPIYGVFPRLWRCWVISISQSPTRVPVSLVPTLSSKPFAKNYQRDSNAVSFCSSTVRSI